MSLYYAGIGSRETPEETQEYFSGIAAFLSLKGLVLRSGGANGADKAFEVGCDSVDGEKEIYLPWRGFEESESTLIVSGTKAFEIAQKFHPNWDRLSDGAKKLQARNTHQVFGFDLETPSKFVICWTKNGKGQGGTGQAIRIAQHYDIPIFDAGKYGDLREIKSNLKEFLIGNGVTIEDKTKVVNKQKRDRKKGIIYKATNTINNKIYIGKTTKTLQRRKTEHISHANHSKTYFKRAINKYGKENFKWEVLEECDINILNDKEKFYIKELKSLYSQNGYNMTQGGDGAAFGDLNPSKRPDVREKLRKASTGFKHNKKTLKIMSEKSKAYYINGMPQEQRDHISQSLKGRKGHQKAKKSYKFISPKGEVVSVYGVRDFARKNNLDHSSLVKLSKGKLKTHKGWMIAHAED